MTKAEKEMYLAMPVSGYFSTLGGVEVVDCSNLKEHGEDITGKCVVISGAWSGNKRVHCVKIHFAGNNPFIILDGERIYFDTFVYEPRGGKQ